MITRTNPEGLYPTRGYHHVVTAEGGRTLYIAGKVAYDANRKLIGGSDVVAQTRATLLNLGVALEACGARPSDVVKITTFVVKYKSDQLQGIAAEIVAFFGEEHTPGNSLIGVECLAADDLLVEIEAVAVVG